MGKIIKSLIGDPLLAFIKLILHKLTDFFYGIPFLNMFGIRKSLLEEISIGSRNHNFTFSLIWLSNAFINKLLPL